MRVARNSTNVRKYFICPASAGRPIELASQGSITARFVRFSRVIPCKMSPNTVTTSLCPARVDESVQKLYDQARRASVVAPTSSVFGAILA